MCKTLQAHVRFIADKKTEQELVTALKDCPYALLKGDPTGYVLFHFDMKRYGKFSTRPDFRTPPLRDALYQRWRRCLLQARAVEEGATTTLQSGDVAILLDGGKPGLKNKLLNPWKEGTTKEGAKKGEEAEDEEADDDEENEDEKPSLTVDTISLMYTEESLSQRKKRIRGTFSLKQLETAYVLANYKLKLPCRDRKNFTGTSAGDVISNIVLPKLSSEWMVEWKDKKEMLTKRHIIAVGGKTEGGEDEPRKDDRLKNKKEPVCFWSAPMELYDEYIHILFAKLVVDLTPSDRFAFVCLRNRVGYVGITFGQVHSEKLENRLLEMLEKDMQDSRSPLYSAAYCKALQKSANPAGSADGDGDRNPKPKPKPKPKPETKPKPKPKGKGKKRNAKEAGVGEEEEEEEVTGGGGDDDDEVWDPLTGWAAKVPWRDPLAVSARYRFETTWQAEIWKTFF